MNRLLLVLLLLLSHIVHADPAPFGLMINKTTVADIKAKYSVTPLGINKNNHLQAFDIEPQQIDFDGLLSAKAAFSDDDILKLVQMSLPKTKFDELYNSLSKKYTIIYKNMPIDGNKEAKFISGNTYILLYAPATSADMDFLYINKRLLDDALQTGDKLHTVQQQRQISQL